MENVSSKNELDRYYRTRQFAKETSLGLDNYDSIFSMYNQFFYIVDYRTHEICYVGGEIEPLIGINRSNFNMDYLLNHAVHPFHRMQVLNISTWSYGIAWKFKDEWGNENRDFNLSAFYKMKKSNERPIYIHRNTQILSRDSKNNVTKGITFITDVSGNFNLKQSALSACIISPYGNKITYKSKQSKIHITESEQKILHYLYHGNTSNQIASRLSISKHTVDTHRRNLLKKFQVNNTPEMLHEAINQSFI